MFVTISGSWKIWILACMTISKGNCRFDTRGARESKGKDISKSSCDSDGGSEVDSVAKEHARELAIAADIKKL